MTDTAPRVDRGLNGAVAPRPAGVVPPPRLRRRPGLIAAAVAATCLGAVLAAWAWSASTSTSEVLVARTAVARGAVIEADDLARVRIGLDPAVRAVPAAEIDKVAGQRAALDIAAGSLVTPDSLSSTVMPPASKSVVGVALSAAQAPSASLQAGDLVRVVVTPGQDGEATSGPPAYNEAEVVGVRDDAQTGQRVVDLLVPHADAALLAARIATGKVALVLDSRER